jgi:hypothetical protein
MSRLLGQKICSENEVSQREEVGSNIPLMRSSWGWNRATVSDGAGSAVYGQKAKGGAVDER